MSDLNISGITTKAINVDIKTNKSITPPNEIIEKNNTNKTTKHAIGAIGLTLTALAATGIYIATKRRFKADKFSKLLQEDKKLLESLPVRSDSFKGKTIQERIQNILGKDSKISPHNYDLSKEYPAMSVYRNQGGYIDGTILPNGIVEGTLNNKYPSIVTQSISNAIGKNNRIIGLEKEERLVSAFNFKDLRQCEGVDTTVAFRLLSPNNKLTPAQLDLERIKANPKLKAEAEKIFDELLKFKDGVDENGKLIHENLGKYEHLDYDVILSVIQSLAKKA